MSVGAICFPVAQRIYNLSTHQNFTTGPPGCVRFLAYYNYVLAT